jgi:hypothetical protein
MSIKIAGLLTVAVIIAATLVYLQVFGKDEIGPENVDLSYLIEHVNEFENKEVKVVGYVKYYASIYQYEDFWLDPDEKGGLQAIPLKVTQIGLPQPPENSYILVEGMVVYKELEGGFYCIHANSWTYA